MSTTTVRTKAAQIHKDWHVIDAAGRSLGRVATEAASLIRGKHKPDFEPHLDCGDFVVVINASKIRLTGRKAETKRYYRHSGYPGGLRERSFEQMLTTFPERIIEQAVWGMLPSGPLGRQMIRHLKVYRGVNHPHESQIVGSQRAQEARAATVQDEIAAADARKPRRLRPLPVPADVAGAAAAAEEARAAKKAAAKEQSEAGAEAAAARVEADAEAEAATAQSQDERVDEAPDDAAAAPTETEEEKDA